MSVVVDSAPSPHTAHHSSRHGILISTIMFTFFAALMVLSLCYIRHLARRNRQNSRVNSTRGEASTITTPSSCNQNGKLKPEVLASLPVFVYPLTPHKEKLECAVCLTEFSKGEKGRVLPKCRHSFHTECIDMWFESHFTCPLCRVNVESESPYSAV